MDSRIVVVGSSNTDMILKLDRLPQPGETLLGGEFATAAGGKGANQAVGAARAGGAVTFVARVGDDWLGAQALTASHGRGTNVPSEIRLRMSLISDPHPLLQGHGGLLGGISEALFGRPPRGQFLLLTGAGFRRLVHASDSFCTCFIASPPAPSWFLRQTG